MVERFGVGLGDRRLFVVAAAATGTALATGMLIVRDLQLAVFAAGVFVMGAVVLMTRASVVRAGTLLLLGGTLILGYGFANLGLQIGGPPIPLTEIILLPLIALVLLDERIRVDLRILVPLFVFAGIVVARLILDYPEYETLAVRDTTLAIEAFALVLGYRAIARDGLGPWLARLNVLFGLLVLYACTFPWRHALQRNSPTVGLQRDVPLLGSFEGLPPRLGVALLFFAVFSWGARRVVLLSASLAIALFAQSRGIYLILPVAVLVLGWIRRASGKVLAASVALVVPAVVVLSLLSAAGGQGRLGDVSASFYSEHVGTLLGGEGKGAGTVDDRLEWARATVDLVGRSPVSVLFGVGLGPDLTFGFRQGGEILVRKPHNDFLEVYARLGLVGFAAFTWLLVVAITPIVRCARRSSGIEGRFCSFVVAGSVVMFGIALTQPLLAFPHGAVPTFFLLGAGYSVARRWEDQETSPGWGAGEGRYSP